MPFLRGSPEWSINRGGATLEDGNSWTKWRKVSTALNQPPDVSVTSTSASTSIATAAAAATTIKQQYIHQQRIEEIALRGPTRLTTVFFPNCIHSLVFAPSSRPVKVRCPPLFYSFLHVCLSRMLVVQNYSIFKHQAMLSREGYFVQGSGFLGPNLFFKFYFCFLLLDGQPTTLLF